MAANLLKALLVYTGSTYIIINGIDEINKRERYRLLKQLIDMSKTCQDVKILISSRAKDDITNLL